MKKDTFELSLFLGTIGIFIPVVIQIIYTKYNYLNLDTNLIVLQYLFLPGIYLICSALIYFKKIDNDFISKLIVFNVLFMGISLIYFAYSNKIDIILNLKFQHLFFIPFLSSVLLVNYIILPFFILMLIIFYKSFRNLNLI